MLSPNNGRLEWMRLNHRVIACCRSWEIDASTSQFDPSIMSLTRRARPVSGRLSSVRSTIEQTQICTESRRAGQEGGGVRRVRLRRSYFGGNLIRSYRRCADPLQTVWFRYPWDRGVEHRTARRTSGDGREVSVIRARALVADLVVPEPVEARPERRWNMLGRPLLEKLVCILSPLEAGRLIRRGRVWLIPYRTGTFDSLPIE